MADSPIRNRLLTLAGEERDIYLRKLSELYRTSRTTYEPLVDDLRRLPAEDMAKKQILQDFFASPAGANYSKQERRTAYDNLLGQHTNKELRG